MIFWYLLAAVLFIAGCAVAMGEGATACVDLDTRSAFVVDTQASAPAGRQKVERPDDKAGVACQGGGGTH